jgi:surface antigen
MSGTNTVLQGTLAKHSRARIRFYRTHSFHLLGAGLLALAASGCSSSLPSLLGDNDKPQPARAEKVKSEPAVSGSLSLSYNSKSTMSPLDWNIAKSALRESLGRAEAGASQPWENPTSGSRGTVTPVAAIYEKNGFPCRNFIVSHVHDSKESWYEGTACRVHRGQWDVTTTRPLQKS